MRRRLLMVLWMLVVTSATKVQAAETATLDSSPPTVASVAPAAGMRNVPLNTTLRIAFDEALDPATVNASTIQLRDTRGMAVGGVITYDAQSSVVTFVPTTLLLPTRTYSATVIGGVDGATIRDAAGNALSATYTSTFVTTVEPARIAAGVTHSVAVDNNGQVWTWGSGTQQRGQALEARLPGAVPGASGVVSVAAGNSHTLALKTDGTLLAWGANTEGQLGIGNQTGQSVPVVVSGISSVIAVAAGATSSMALKADGTVWTWGSAHQIGDGLNTRRLTPTQVPALADVIAIASGDVAGYALKADGTVWAWGDNTSGQIGDGSGGSGIVRLTPVQVTTLSNVVAIAGGAQHALAIVGSTLSVRAWGLNASGQIGDGTTNTQRYVPTPINGLVDVRSIDGAGNRSLAALPDGTLQVWGAAATATGANISTPIAAPGNPLGFQVTGSTNHNLAVTAAGTVWTWGLNTSSQLGDGTSKDRRVADKVSGDDYVWRVGTPTFSVAGGTYPQTQSVTITTATAGAVLHFTLNGIDPVETDPEIPTSGVVVIERSLTLKVAGWKPGASPSSMTIATYTLQAGQPAFSPNGGTFTTGTSITMSTATAGAAIHYTVDGSTPTAVSPVYSTPIDIATTLTVKAVATRPGWTDSTVRSATFTMNFGTLGPPTLAPAPGGYEGQITVTMAAQEQSTIRYTTNGASPTATSTVYDGPVTLTSTTTIKAKAFRADYTTSVETFGTYTIVAVPPVFSRASGTYPPGTSVTITDSDPGTTIRITLNGLDPTNSDTAVQSGTTLLVGSFTLKARAFKTGSSNSTVASAAFELTEPLGSGMVSAGGTHTLLATPGGLLYVWGLGTSGQLGLGSTASKSTPTIVPTLTGVVSVSGGLVHTLAATSDGRLFAWGSNSSGRLGDGTTKSSQVPLEITSLHDVVQVAAGGSHSLALTADGRVYAWGVGASGQLGLGPTTNVLVPTPIPMLSDVAAIAAGALHSLAVTRTGDLYVWGANSLSQLGDGTQTTQTTPKRLTSISGVTAIAAGATHSVARLSDGTVYSWGDNSYGQLGVGDTTVRRWPTRISDLRASSIAAGGNHTMAIGTDGVLVAWGANASGQVGDTTTTNRVRAVPVAGPTGVAAVAGGTTHSAAVTMNGHVWTWGSGGSGQLGDGTTVASRLTPLDVFTAPGSWELTPAPLLSVAPGIYSSVLTVVISDTLGAAASMHFTTSGATPTIDDPAIADGESVTVDRNVTLKVRAWASGRTPSATVTAEYVLQPVAPSVTPGSATYSSTQAVTLSSPISGAVVRYTIDGTDPSGSSPLYTDPIPVATFTVIKAKTFHDGWTPSATATATFTFNYGVLPTPTITPPAGRYAPGKVVTISAGAGQQVRYTLDGTDPTSMSPAYVAPIPLPPGLVSVKARAFGVDWTESPIASANYVVTDDVEPPTITVSFSSLPNAQGWYVGDMTATFTCEDPSGVKWCTPPTRIGGEGFELPVVANAVDVWGNHSMAAWTINIDRTPPDLRIYTPKNNSHVQSGTTSITVRGGAHDLSGVDEVLCNGVVATVVDDAFVCGVAVGEGLNTITVEASDRSGHSANTELSVIVGDVTVRAVDVSPATLTMFVGDTREIFVKDQEGGERHDGTWSISDSAIATVVDADGATTISALDAGQTTLIVTINGVTATVAVTVLPIGETISTGTTLWSLADTLGVGPPKRGYVLRASSTVADADASRSAALFFVDEGTEYFDHGTELTRGYPNRPTQIRATTADGRRVSEMVFSGRIPRQIAADNDGGYVLVFAQSDGEPSIIQRVYGATGTVAWEYKSFSGFLSDVAVHPDGTVYATEKRITGANRLVAINRTGGVQTFDLPIGTYSQIDLGDCGWYGSGTIPGSATAPIILEEGSVVLVTRTRVSTQIVRTYPDPNSSLGCSEQRLPQDFSFRDTQYVVELPSAGDTLHAHELSDPGFLPSQFTEERFRLLPDGHGGLLLGDRRTPTLIHISSEYTVDAGTGDWFLMPGDTSTKYETEYVLGEDGLYVLVNSRAITQIYPSYQYAFSTKVLQLDPQTLMPKADPTRLGEPMLDPQHIRLKFALAGGGIYANGPWSAYAVNATADSSAFAAGGNAAVFGDDLWGGWRIEPLLATGGTAFAAASSWPTPSGTEGRNESKSILKGIFFKGQHVDGTLVARHASIRITPHNQSYWLAAKPQAFGHFDYQGRFVANIDALGNYFATIGAGPGTDHTRSDDTVVSCSAYNLTNAVSFSTDVLKAAENFEPLQYRADSEDFIIGLLFRLDDNYQDDLPYCAAPTLFDQTYNSNSYVHGLMRAVGLQSPMATSGTSHYVGWTKPVPSSHFAGN
jgi:alpha-tubulin suppressor-like RCC1 family protein